MKRSRYVASLLVIGLSACGTPSDKTENQMAGNVEKGFNIKELSPTKMMANWEQLVQHTKISTPGRATHPSASRDGKMFVYASTETSSKPQIYMRSMQGIAPTQLTNNNAMNLFPRISPNGKLVAFASNVSGNWDIYVIRIDAPVTWMQVTNGPEDEIAPSWSPDGKKVVFCKKTKAGYWRVVYVNISTGIPTYLGAGMYPDWSPHSDERDQWIAFQSQPRGTQKSAIWVVRPNGTQLREVVADRHKEWAAVNPRWSTDGKWIAYATVQRSRESKEYGEADEADDLWIIMPDGRYDTRLTDDFSAEWWPAWGGDRLLFVSIRKGYQNIYSVRPRPLVD